MASTIASFAFAYKQWYTKARIAWLTNRVSPFFAKLDKKLFSGTPYITPAVISNPQSASADFTSAQQGATQTTGGNLQGVQWISQVGDYNSMVRVGEKALAGSRDNAGAFFENKKVEIDGMYKTFGNAMGNYALNSAGHTLTPGNFVFTSASGLCTCTDPNDTNLIEKGQILNISVNNGDAAADILVAGQGDGFVISVNRNAGTFVVSATSGGAGGAPTNWANATTYFAFRKGDFGGTGVTRSVLGFGAWIPAADPTATLFESVDRTQDITALSGTRLQTAELAGLNTEQRIRKLLTRMYGRNSSEPATDVVVHPEKWDDVVTSLENKGLRGLATKEKIGGFGFQKLSVQMSPGEVSIWADPKILPSAIFAVNFDYCHLASYSGFPALIDRDGNAMLRVGTANDYEVRCVCFPVFQAQGPGFQGRTTAA